MGKMPPIRPGTVGYGGEPQGFDAGIARRTVLLLLGEKSAISRLNILELGSDVPVGCILGYVRTFETAEGKSVVNVESQINVIFA